jgi:hypothetical protein
MVAIRFKFLYPDEDKLDNLKLPMRSMKGIKMTLYHHLADYGHRVSLASITMTLTLFRQVTQYRHLRYQIPANSC